MGGEKILNEKMKLDLNEHFLNALHIMEDTDRNVFVTGRAGTGKSTLLQHFRNNTKKALAVIAPTGVAAVNVKGQTIHSFFNFKIDVTPDTVKKIRPRDKAIYKNLDAIVVDEISMVRADILDCIDIFLRIHGKKKSLPFGGIQMIFIGDLYQLPPVVRYREKAMFSEYYKSPYFFDSKVFSNGLDMEFIELEKVYRQKDERFLNILNAIRNNTASDDDFTAINLKHLPDFEDNGKFYICLTTTNELADSINQKKLSEVKGKEYKYHGIIDGNFDIKDLPTGQDIAVKIGAQVMLLNNDSYGRWINGSIGKIVEIEEIKNEPDIIWVELSDGSRVDVVPYTWEMYEFDYDRGKNTVASEITGRFTQHPIKFAWAVTIHKSQGLTFERMVIDIGRGTFSHGQLYVALSRCTNLDGIILKKPIMKRHIFMDRRIVEFVTKYQYKRAKERQPLEQRISMIEQAIKEKRKLDIVYLKAKDEKTRRTIIPKYMGELEYQGKKFLGLEAFCTKRMQGRVFNIEKILEMRIAEGS